MKNHARDKLVITVLLINTRQVAKFYQRDLSSLSETRKLSAKKKKKAMMIIKKSMFTGTLVAGILVPLQCGTEIDSLSSRST